MIPRGRLRAALVTAFALLAGCLDTGITQPKLIGEGRRVLFIGNSYLYTKDIPAIVQALANAAGGDKLAISTVAGPDMALIDHWHEGTARREIAKGGWEWVVMQQGPSSLEISRDTLRLAVGYFASEMASVNATPALFSAWPQLQHLSTFPRAIESYQIAATDVSGLYLPVAPAWLGAWSRDASVGLYEDGLHPSSAGAYLAALVVYGRLLGQTTTGLPSSLVLHGGRGFSVPPATAALLQAAADSALATPP